MASTLVQHAGLGTTCKFGAPSLNKATSDPSNATPLPIKPFIGACLYPSSISISGQALSLSRHSRRSRQCVRKSVSAHLDKDKSVPEEVAAIEVVRSEIAKSQASQNRGFTLAAYAAGIVLAAACSLAMPKAAHAKVGLADAPPGTSTQKIQIPKKRGGVVRENLDPDSVRPVPLPNRDGSVPREDRAAKIEARKQQLAEFKRRLLREEAAIKKKLEEDPKDEKVLQRLVDVLLVKNDVEGVKDTLRKMIEHFPDDYRYRLMLVEVASGTRSLDEALEVAKAASEKFPRVPEMVQTYAMMLMASDQQDAALTFAREKVAEAVRTEATEENGKEFAVGMKLLLGQILSAVGDFDGAHAHFSEMIEADPSDFRPRVSKGLLFQLKGDTEKAEEQFTKVMELLPEDFPEREAVITMIETARRQKEIPDADDDDEDELPETPAAVAEKLAEQRKSKQESDKPKTEKPEQDQSTGKKKGWKLW